MSTKTCLFCGSKNLTREHIYSKWILDIYNPEEKSFKPDFRLIKRSNSNAISDLMLEDSSDGRKIRFEDFAIKCVCSNCNNGWMSDLERQVQPTLKELFEERDIGSINSPEANALAKWAIIKVLMIALTTQEKVLFSFHLYNLLKGGIIPEGFIVEIGRLKHKSLNFFIGGQLIRKAFDLSRDELDFGTSSFFRGCIQVADIAFRVTFLRTEVPVFRVQLQNSLFVLYPYNIKMPFQQLEVGEVNYENKLELPIWGVQIGVHD